MKGNRGIAILLFAILLQLCSAGLEIVTLAIGLIGLAFAFVDNRNANP